MKVSVVMITYGHEKFIREAIEGVLKQECDFEVELIIANDCSPDETDGIIQKILKNHSRASWIRYFNHPVNLGMMSNFIFALNQTKGEFIALCDGDDYWTDSLKLQKQVDFLTSDISYIACFHNVSVLNDSKIESYPQNRKEGAIPVKDVVLNGGGVFPTAAILFRNQVTLPDFTVHSNAGDSALAFSLIEKGYFYYFDDIMAIYRKHEGGVYSSIKNDNNKRREDIISNLNLLVNYRRLAIKTPKKYYNQAILKQLNQFSNHFGVSKVIQLRKSSVITSRDFIFFMIKKIQYKFR